MSDKLSRAQRSCLADAYAARARKGLHKDGLGDGWRDPDLPGEFYSGRTVQSLVTRGLLSLWVRGTVAHVTDSGALVHEELCEREQAHAA